VFVAFGAEEAPGDLEGSRHFVATAAAGADGLAHVVMMVNLDMVGSYDADGVVMALGTFRGLPGRAVVAAAAKTRPGLQVAMGGQGRGSDHEPFCAAGIPYVFFWTPGGRCYHATCDTAERVDVEHMAEIVALAAEVTGELAQTETDLVAAKAKHGCGGR
jgi:Zn-dependent M28 family amino/carboxypeptidase